MMKKEGKKLLIGIAAIVLLLAMGALMLTRQCADTMEQQGMTSPLELFDLPIPVADPQAPTD